MGPSKKHPRNMKPQAQFRSRTTRSSKGRLLSDPAQNTQLLTEQLRSLGLYAAPTLGDGNCLFRALSDQMYGTPSHHQQLRKDICDWIEAHKQRYEPFVEDDRGLDVHLRCMRENATYGGHMELSAFAHLTRRNVKVIQPGLVYVIEWAAGGDPTDPHDAEDPPPHSDKVLHERDKRRMRRDKKRAEKDRHVEPCDTDDDTSSSSGAIYVAYHDWEHFSSIRNLNGPHTGLPCVQEMSADASLPPTPEKKKPISKVKLKVSQKPSSKPAPDPKLSEIIFVETAPPTPSQIPLPGSRSPSPDVCLLPFQSSLPISATPSLTPINIRIHRSPKRSFDESSGSSASSEGIAKRTRSSRLSSTTPRRRDVPEVQSMDVDDAASTPELSAPCSSGESSSSLSDASSPLPTTPPPAASPPPERPLTRRQRKALGLPKARSALIAARTARGAGKIVIPGGRCKKGFGRVRSADGDDDEEDDEDGDAEGEENAEWRRNGTGRVDVRGFRELKI